MEVIQGIMCDCGAMLKDPWDGERPPQGAVVECPKCHRLHIPRGLNADRLVDSGMSEHDAREVEVAARRLLANERPPNFRTNGSLYLVRCFICEPEHGRENYAPSVATGVCAWCGWSDEVT